MNRSTQLSIAFLKTHPAAAARVLDQLPPREAAAFIAQVPEDIAAPVLNLLQTGRAAQILAQSTPQAAVDLLMEMATPSRSVVLRALPKDALEAILAAAPKRKSAALRRFLSHDPGTVGAWMDAPQATFGPDITVGACLSAVRQSARRLGSSVCVVDEKRRLLGLVAVDVLLSAEDQAPLGEIMRREVEWLAPQATLAAAVSSRAWETALTMPVCERGRRLIGILHFESLREGLVDDQSPLGAARMNVMLTHLAQAFLVTLSGLLRIAIAEPEITRLSEGQET
ncbi:MAG: hypothetical protein QNJ67_21645 [Kiloniellales bacterium]|nr:hypothetical protein [Kiloniellales bacterium]